MPAAARLTDKHVCPIVMPSAHVGGVIAPPGAMAVKIGYQPAATVGSTCACPVPGNAVSKGSLTVKIGYLDAARLGDPTAHGGFIVTGDPNVIIG